MPTISFQFAATAGPQARTRALHQLKAQPGVRDAGLIDPDSPDADASRMAFAETTDANVESVVAHLRAAGAEGVAVEGRRGLA